MEDHMFYTEDGYELLDAETSRMIDELTEGIEVAPYPSEEGRDESCMISLTALRGNAEATAESFGHFMEWQGNQVATCLHCAAQGNVSLDPLILGERETGTYYHGPLFNEECVRIDS